MAYLGAGLTRFNTADELTVTGDAQIDTNTLVVDSTNNRVGILNASPATALDVNGTLTASTVAVAIVDVSNEIQLEGAAGNDGLIQKNASSGRDELQIYAGGDAYDSGSRGAGIHLYGNSDSQHSGDMAFLTGPNDNGDARIIISGHEDKTRVTIGNAIFDYVDNNNDPALLNLKDPSGQPALLIEGASSSEGDIVTPDGEALQIGHWNKTSSSFTERLCINSSGKIGIGTTSPDQTLHVHKGSAGSVDSTTNAVITLENSTHGILQFLTPNNVSNQIRFGDVDDNGRGYIDYNHNTDNLSIAVSGSEAMRIDSAGSVGIGTSSPTSYANGQNTLVIEDTGNPAIALSDTGQAKDWYIIAFGDGMAIRYAEGGGSGGVVSFTENIFFKNNGNIGINDSNPAYPLEVNGTVRAVGTNNLPALIVDGNSTNEGDIVAATGDILTFGHHGLTGASGQFTERMRIASTGELLVGTTSDTMPTAAAAAQGIMAGTRTFIATETNGDTILGGTTGSNFTAFYQGGSERMRIDSSGHLHVGRTTTDSSVVGFTAQSNGLMYNAFAGRPYYVNRLSSDGDIIELAKDGTTVGRIGVSGNGIYFGDEGDTGIAFDSNSDAITPLNPSTRAIRDNAMDVGVSNARFDDIHATNGTIQTSDENEKQNIASLTSAEITAATAISKLFKTFKWKDKVAAKGDNARTHTGVVAQQVQSAMTDAGLDASKYAFWCSDTWTNDDGNEQTRMGVRYPELLAFIGAATEQRLANIETRLTALEG